MSTSPTSHMENVCWKCENDAPMKLYIYYYFVIIKWDLFIFNMNTFTGASYQLPVMMNNEFMK